MTRAPSRIVFLGDVHGCVFHALEAVRKLQGIRGICVDAVIQVGDLGAYPTRNRLDTDGRHFIAMNPAQGDFFRLLPADDCRGRAGGVHPGVPPVWFISGNHDDVVWLDGLHDDARGPVVPVDPRGLFHHVRSGHVQDLAGLRIAFLGGIEALGVIAIDPGAYRQLWQLPACSIDVLVTHDGPYGMATWQGDVQGSRMVLQLVERLQPRLHVSGHYHHMNGPRQYGRTASYALAQLVPPHEDPEESGRSNVDQRVSPGSIAVFDPELGVFEYVEDSWLGEVCGGDLGDYVNQRWLGG